MELNKDLVRSINEMSIQSGDGLILDDMRIDPCDNPALFIGIGGTGCSALRMLKKQINVKFKKENSGQVPKHFAFVGIDTDQNDTESNNISLSLNNDEKFYLSEGDFTANIRNGSVTGLDWYDDRLNRFQLDPTGGAGQYRQLGRVMLHENALRLSNAFQRCIKKITTDKTEKLLVFILTGIGGGTGSGTFIDISYIIRDVVKRQNTASCNRAVFNGYIFLPDVNINDPALSELAPSVSEKIKANGYAALKELDYWMGCNAREEVFKNRYNGGYTIAIDKAIYDHCWLMSAKNADGRSSEDGHIRAKATAAHNICVWLTASEGTPDNNNDDVFGMESFLINKASMTQSFIATQQDIGMFKTVNYSYASCGGNVTKLPRAMINTYIAVMMFRDIEIMHDRSYDANQVKNTIKDIVDNIISSDKLQKKIESSIKRDIPANIVTIPPGVNASSIKNATHKSNIISSAYNRAIDDMNLMSLGDMDAVLKETTENLNDAIREIFLDFYRGPFFTRPVVMNDDKYSLYTVLVALKKQAQKELHRAEDSLDAAEEKAASDFLTLQRAVVGNGEKFKRYVAAFEDKLLYNIEIIKYEKLVGVYDKLIEWICSEADTLYTLCETTLNVLGKLFQRNGKFIDSEAKHKKEGDVNVYSWNLMNATDIVNFVKEWFSENYKSESCLKSFFHHFLAEIDKVRVVQKINKKDSIVELNSSSVNIQKILSNFISKEFNELVRKTMWDYIAYDAIKKNVSIQEYFTELFTELIDGSAPALYTNLSNVNSTSNISIPIEYTEIYDEWVDYRTRTGKFSSTAQLSTILSFDNDSISVNKAFVGIPLFALVDVNEWDKEYLKVINNPTGATEPGLHSIMGTDENWIGLADVIPFTTRSNDDPASIKNLREDYNRGGSLFDELEEKSVIFMENNTRKYRHLLNVEGAAFDISEIEKQYNVGDVAKGEQIDVNQKNQVIAKLNDLKDIITGKTKIPATTDPMFNVTFTIKEYPIQSSRVKEMAKEYFIRYFHGRRKAEETLTLYDKITERIDYYNNIVGEYKKWEDKCNTYFRASLLGDIFAGHANVELYSETIPSEDKDSKRGSMVLAKAGTFDRYYSFKALGKLPEEQLEMIIKIIDDKYVALSPNDELENIRANYDDLKESVKSHQYLMHSYIEDDRAEAVNFYKLMEKLLNDLSIKKLLKK